MTKSIPKTPAMSTTVERPDASEYGSSCAGYVELVPEGEIIAILETQLADMLKLLGNVSEKVGDTVHAPYRWTVKEVVGHILDCERVFGYRALRIARADMTPLAGFDENEYARHANFKSYALSDLLEELAALRRSHVSFFRHLAAATLLRVGTANGQPISVRALAYVVAGHAEHHLQILKKRLARG